MLRFPSRFSAIFDFVINNLCTSCFSRRHNLFCPYQRKHAYQEAHYQHGSNNTIIANTASFHSSNFTATGKLTKCHQSCQEHRHREGIVNNFRQAIKEQSCYRFQRCTILGNILCNSKEHGTGNKNTGESSNAKYKRIQKFR